MSRLPTYERLREVLEYDSETGVFRRRLDGRVYKRGDLAGSVSSHGYYLVGIDGANHYGHRLAYLYMTGEEPGLVDHKDGDRLNNRWANLRLADRSQNAANTTYVRPSTTGFRGVYKVGSKYLAKINHKGKQVHLGTFGCAEEAGAAYVEAAKTYFGEFARCAA